ncbi:MAG: lipid kinase [Hyphomicrobiales bacterium]|nr:lipid kinase [Hyphomicrobiales bacterium]
MNLPADDARTAPPAHRARRALLLRNPASRRGEENFAPILDRLEAGGVIAGECDVGDPARIAAAARAADLIIVAGGDGTLHHAAPVLLEVGKPFGLLPMGTANDLARSLGVPEDPLAAADVIVAGATRRIDLGDVNGTPYFNVASIGLSVQLARELTQETKRRFGTLGYAVAGLRALSKARRFTAWIEAGGRTRRARTFQIAVGNGRYYGGGMSVNQRCEIGDGQLYLYSLEMRSLWRLALMAFDFRAGVHGEWEDVQSETGERFVVRTRRPKAINADGEIVSQTPAVFTIRRQALEVFAPPP